MQLSKNNLRVLLAVEQGFKVINGQVFCSQGNPVKCYLASGYLSFRLKHTYKTWENVNIHKLVAYQKFGEKLFEPKVVVRHLDGNKLNNLDENISIGYDRDNYMDRSPEARKAQACKSAIKKLKFDFETIELIRKDRESGMTYSDLSKKYGMKKESFSYLFHRSLYYKDPEEFKRLINL